MVGVGHAQTMQVNIFAVDPCAIELTIADSNGSTIAQFTGELAANHSKSLTLDSPAKAFPQRGELHAAVTLQPTTTTPCQAQASVEVFVFPKTMAEYAALLDDDAVVILKARLDLRDDRLKLVCMEVHRPELTLDGRSDLRISLPLHHLTDGKVDGLKRLLLEHPGDSPVFLHVGDKLLALPSEFNVDSRRGLVGELRGRPAEEEDDSSPK